MTTHDGTRSTGPEPVAPPTAADADQRLAHDSGRPDGHLGGTHRCRKRQSIGAGGIDPKKTIIGGIVAVVFLAIVFTRVIPQIGSYPRSCRLCRP